jgi:hypothetical protein
MHFTQKKLSGYEQFSFGNKQNKKLREKNNK